MKALELINDFDYTPKFLDNDKDPKPMVFKVHLLSMGEDLSIIKNGRRDEVAFFKKAIKSIENPIPLKVDGKPERPIVAEDIALLAGLKVLWNEFMEVYIERTALDRKN